MPRVSEKVPRSTKVTRMRSARTRREWEAFHERALAPLTYGEIRQVVSADESPHAAIEKASIERWDAWHRALCAAIRYGTPENIPTPPPEPEGLWDKARGDGDASALVLLAYARARR